MSAPARGMALWSKTCTPCRAGPRHLEVHLRRERGADVLQVEVAPFGGQAQVEGAAGLVGDAGDLEGVVGPVVGHAEGEGGDSLREVV